MKRREIVEQDVIEAYNTFGTIAAGIINDQHQEVEAQLFLVQLDDKPGRLSDAMAIDPRLINEFQRSGKGKDIMMEFIRQLLTPGNTLHDMVRIQANVRPDIAVHISEVWLAHIYDLDDPRVSIPASQREDKRESLMISVHVPDYTYLGHSLIEGKGAKRRVTLVPLDVKHITAGGRLTMQGDAEEQWVNDLLKQGRKEEPKE